MKTRQEEAEMAVEASGSVHQMAEVWCLHCGRGVGTWEWPIGASPRAGTFRPHGDDRQPAARPPRCPGCGGPVYLDDVRTVREREPVVYGRSKAGRKRKNAAA